MEKLIAVFDIGKTNKKLLLFDEKLQLHHQEEGYFEQAVDEDGFPCDDILKIEQWMLERITKWNSNKNYKIQALNFTTYGATLLYLDKNGKRLTPAYNYLKPISENTLDDFYKTNDGISEFSRKTASPSLGMLNSGFQILELKKSKPEVFEQVKYILHFPQYLSYQFTGKITSEYTSIGCHTALWDFDKNEYHSWITNEKIELPAPHSNFDFQKCKLSGNEILVGSGLHDSSSSLIPYLIGSQEKFILISTGTWSIFMNPFNDEPLTLEQLENDCLCYLSVFQKQIKSSRLFLGQMHDSNMRQLSDYFRVDSDDYKSIKANENWIEKLFNQSEYYFFKSENPDLSKFQTFEEAYHQLIFDLIKLAKKSMDLIISEKDDTTAIYITGGFSRSEIFVRMIATIFPEKKVFTSQIDNATAFGAAILADRVVNKQPQNIDLGLSQISPFNFSYCH